jgi:hypothetical protein
MPKDPPGYGEPYSWAENQDYIERPRMRGEGDTAYSVRRSIASLSAAIISSLQSHPYRRDY